MTGAIGPETGAGHTRTHTAVEPVACRGLSSDGQLVDGNAADSPTPVAVLGWLACKSSPPVRTPPAQAQRRHDRLLGRRTPRQRTTASSSVPVSVLTWPRSQRTPAMASSRRYREPVTSAWGGGPQGDRPVQRPELASEMVINPSDSW